MKNTLLMLMLALTSGCAKMHNLETTNANLEEVNSDLLSTNEEIALVNHYLCAWTLEAQTSGIVAYIGNHEFYDGRSRTIEEYKNLDADCLDAVKGYMKEMPTRRNLLEKMLDENPGTD